MYLFIFWELWDLQISAYDLLTGPDTRFGNHCYK